MNTEHLFSLTLADGLPVLREGKAIRYKQVILRETGVADERIAVRLAERVLHINGLPQILLSKEEFKLAMSMRHCDKFVCPGVGELGQDVMELDIFDKLSSHDLQLIEDRVLLIELAAQVRYGLMTEQQYHQFVAGKGPVSAPQPEGQAGAPGEATGAAGSGPEMLADFAGAGAAGAAGSVGS